MPPRLREPHQRHQHAQRGREPVGDDDGEWFSVTGVFRLVNVSVPPLTTPDPVPVPEIRPLPVISVPLLTLAPPPVNVMPLAETVLAASESLTVTVPPAVSVFREVKPIRRLEEGTAMLAPLTLTLSVPAPPPLRKTWAEVLLVWPLTTANPPADQLICCDRDEYWSPHFSVPFRGCRLQPDTGIVPHHVRADCPRSTWAKCTPPA